MDDIEGGCLHQPCVAGLTIDAPRQLFERGRHIGLEPAGGASAHRVPIPVLAHQNRSGQWRGLGIDKPPIHRPHGLNRPPQFGHIPGINHDSATIAVITHPGLIQLTQLNDVAPIGRQGQSPALPRTERGRRLIIDQDLVASRRARGRLQNNLYSTQPCAIVGQRDPAQRHGEPQPHPGVITCSLSRRATQAIA